ncbi:MAG TPA: hypothetical protein VE135_09030 [Pyrinomonadaceae bacterium]|nr:hypothetical protein [Pyrinomonadaceae bacterium]
MKAFCPEHKRGFFAPRQSPIKCGNRGHALGELDFQGEAKLPVELHWQFCCNCEHFCPIDFEKAGLERCPTCTRRSSLVYLCDRCYTISFESNTPLQTKNFTLTPDGAPVPSCPGCLQPSSANLREHTCDELGSSFITALNSCPVCRERLDVGPSFPSPVALYLRKTKAANKLNVTFDYENEVFAPVEDGEFVLISNDAEAVQPIVIPRSATFATPRDFYEFYQDFYLCPQPGAGEVRVLEPAVVVLTVDGWKLQTAGVLEVIKVQSKTKLITPAASPRSEPLPEAKRAASHSSKDDSVVDKRNQQAAVLDMIKVQSKTKPAAPNTPPRADPPPDSEPPSSSRARDAGTLCNECGTLVESRYAFCWKCGNALTTERSSVTQPAAPYQVRSAAPVEDEDDEQTVQHDLNKVRSPILSLATPPQPQEHRSAKGSILKLAVAAFMAILMGSLGVLLTRSPFRKASVAAAEPPMAEARINPSVVTVGSDTHPMPEPTTAQKPEDYELSKLRERLIAANRSERSAILQTFARTEKKYPHDYRFPYERAKLAIEGSDKTSHHDAFAALSVAAEKAISSGKASEMLENLQKDSGGDFQKLSHGHHEWAQLQEALKSNDARVLDTRMGL